MEILRNLLAHTEEFIPVVIAVVGVVLVIAVARLVLHRRYGSVAGDQLKIQLTIMVLSFFGLVVIILALPISETKTGQILSLLGILLSAAIALSATTFVGNIMAGLMLRAVRNFRPGDFVRVGDHFGRISVRGLFHVELQTEDRDLTTLPNLYLVTNPVKVTRADGTFISADVSLGYDVFHGDIQRVMVEAAEDAGLTEPFAHVIELGDFSVTYRVSGLLTEVKTLLSARSRLREAVLDHLHRAGVEIVSPTFMNQRVWPTTNRFVPSPRGGSKAEEASSGAPESVVFDKADEAESLDKLQEQLKTISDEIKNVEGWLDEATDENEKNTLKERLQSLENRHDRLSTYIKGRKDNT